ncbi:hypothetical protein Tco_1191065, partial [Tanacetum coccineum]
MRDIGDNYPRGQVDALREEEVRAENQDLRTRLATSEGNERSMVACLLWMEDRISALKQRPPGPQGPPNGLVRADVLLYLLHFCIATKLLVSVSGPYADGTMSTTGQGMSFAEIEQIVAQRVTNAIEAIAIYETKTRVARDSIDQVARQGAK